MKIIIAASGPSLNNYTQDDFNDHPIMYVNGAIDHLTANPPNIHPRYWFTLDPSKANMARVNDPRPNVQYYMATTGTSWIPGVTMLNRVATQYTLPPNDNSPEYWFKRWSCTPGMQPYPNIATGNSSYGALQLAIHLGYNDIYIIGVDGGGQYFNSSNETRELTHLPLLFKTLDSHISQNNINVTVDENSCLHYQIKEYALWKNES